MKLKPELQKFEDILLRNPVTRECFIDYQRDLLNQWENVLKEAANAPY